MIDNKDCTVLWPSPLKCFKMLAKKGSGNIVCNKLFQTLDCDATNQITPFAINMQNAQFIMKIFTKNATRVQKGSMATLSAWA